MTHFVDRSRVEAGHQCQRKRFWSYHYDGRGITPVIEGLDLTFGKAIHADLEYQLNGWGHAAMPDMAASTKLPDGGTQDQEWAVLYRGLTGTFKEWVLPSILETYEVLGTEVELTTELAPGIQWMTRLDAVLRRKADGLYFVLEAKTSSWMDKLFAGLPYNFQLLMEVESLRRAWDKGSEEMGGALVLAFNKGQNRSVSDAERRRGLEGKRRLSPFTYWYARTQANGLTDYSLEYKAGWDRMPTWTIPDWWQMMKERWSDAAREQVQLWPSVSFDTLRVESIIRQIVGQEKQNVAYETNDWQRPGEALDFFWPQNFGACMDFGRPCPFADCCFSPTIGRDPLASGQYVVRDPNHKQELTSE